MQYQGRQTGSIGEDCAVVEGSVRYSWRQAHNNRIHNAVLREASKTMFFSGSFSSGTR